MSIPDPPSSSDAAVVSEPPPATEAAPRPGTRSVSRRWIGIAVIVAGAIFLIAGVITWIVVQASWRTRRSRSRRTPIGSPATRSTVRSRRTPKRSHRATRSKLAMAWRTPSSIGTIPATR